MSNKTTTIVNEINPIIAIQLFINFSILVGYLLGIFGSWFLAYYALVAWWLIPFTIANLILSITEEQTSARLNVSIFICALLTLLPIFGFLPAIVGMVLTIIAIVRNIPELITKERPPVASTTSKHRTTFIRSKIRK